MQIIVEVEIDPDSYVSEQYQRRVARSLGVSELREGAGSGSSRLLLWVLSSRRFLKWFFVRCGCVRLSARLPLGKGLRLVHKRPEGEVAAAGAPATAPALALSQSNRFVNKPSHYC